MADSSDHSSVFFRSDLDSVRSEQLQGFFVGWPDPPCPQRHLEILKASHGVELAVHENTGQVVGFINVISDGIFSAFIPLLEVLPDYQGQGIGKQLVENIVRRYQHLYMLDLCCDEAVVPFYESVAFHRVVGLVRRNFEHQSGQ